MNQNRLKKDLLDISENNDLEHYEHEAVNSAVKLLRTQAAKIEALEREKQVSAMEYLALEGQCREHLDKIEGMRKDAERLDWLLEKCDDVDICSGLSFLFQDYTNIKDGIDAAINGEQA